MIAREIGRRPLRFLLSVAGIAMGVAIFVMGRFSWDSFDNVMSNVFAREHREAFRAYLDRLTSDDLRRIVHNLNSAGDEFDNAIEDILVHVAMHGTYHRGQVTLLVRDAGAEPQPTDYIAFVRGAPAATRASVPRAPVHDR